MVHLGFIWGCGRLGAGAGSVPNRPGSTWQDLGAIRGRSWVDLGGCLGLIRGRFGADTGPIWGRSGVDVASILGRSLGSSGSDLGSTRGRCWSLWELLSTRGRPGVGLGHKVDRRPPGGPVDWPRTHPISEPPHRDPTRALQLTAARTGAASARVRGRVLHRPAFIEGLRRDRGSNSSCANIDLA